MIIGNVAWPHPKVLPYITCYYLTTPTANTAPPIPYSSSHYITSLSTTLKHLLLPYLTDPPTTLKQLTLPYNTSYYLTEPPTTLKHLPLPYNTSHYLTAPLTTSQHLKLP